MIEWFIATKTGRAVALGIAVAASVGVSWWAFSSHYERVGYRKCQEAYAKAVETANKQQLAKNDANDKTSAKVGQKTADNVAQSNKAADNAAGKNKETINDVYAKPIRTAPVALGSCVHPVDARVQDAIESATNRARKSP